MGSGGVCPRRRINQSLLRTNRVRGEAGQVKGFFPLFLPRGFNYSPSLTPNFPKYIYGCELEKKNQADGETEILSAVCAVSVLSDVKIGC